MTDDNDKEEFEKELGVYLEERKKADVATEITEKAGQVATEAVKTGEGWLSRLFKRAVTVPKKEEFVEVSEERDKIHDLKAVAKVALAAIKQLPPDKLSTFKESSEFKEFKEILDRHKLIK